MVTLVKDKVQGRLSLMSATDVASTPERGVVILVSVAPRLHLASPVGAFMALISGVKSVLNWRQSAVAGSTTAMHGIAHPTFALS